MITLLLGSNGLAKKEYIDDLAKKAGAEIQTFTENSALLALGSLFEQQLFGAPKAVVLDHVWKNLDPTELLETVGAIKAAQLFIIEDSLDKRKKVNTEFLKDKRVTVVQLDAPIGTRDSADWIVKFAKQNNIDMQPAAGNALARALLVDEDSTLNVARAQNEIIKLSAFADGKPITAEMVGELTENITGVDIFALLNAIATKNKKLALQMLDDYFESETADEKSNAIKVGALLADQFRSLLITVDASVRNLPDTKILEITGWKSGRLFIMKRLAGNFTVKQLQQALAKLENLDREMKTGSMPPHVVLDLIIADM